MNLTLPKFASEAEEADWWYEHREELGRALVQASQESRLGEGSVGRRERKLREMAQTATAARQAETAGK